MIFANIHWLVSGRYKDIIGLSSYNGRFLKLMIFELFFFWTLYTICRLTSRVDRMLFKFMWFEVASAKKLSYILIKQLKYIVTGACHYYYHLTQRTGFELTLSSKLLVLCFSTLTILLKVYVLFVHKGIGYIYVGEDDADTPDTHIVGRLLSEDCGLLQLPLAQ